MLCEALIVKFLPSFRKKKIRGKSIDPRILGPFKVLILYHAVKSLSSQSRWYHLFLPSPSGASMLPFTIDYSNLG